MTDETTRISISDLESRVEAIFVRAGVTQANAGALARVITAGERDNCKSHGIYRIEGCLNVLKAGKVDGTAIPKLDSGAGPIVRVKANAGFSSPAYEAARDTLTARAHDLGMAALVINDCLHFSALWYEAEDLANQGLAALSMCPSYATVAPAGGSKPLLGTNPFAFGWPRKTAEPYVFDFATSVAARGEVELHRRAGKPLPEGWALDEAGAPTTDPEAALSGALLPFGAHKGSAISTMIELLAGALIGDFMSREAVDYMGGANYLPRHGALIIAFDPNRFSQDRGRDPLADGEKLLGAMQEQTGRLPSQRRYTARALAEAEGIALSADEVSMLDRFEKEGLEALDP